jgi:hypothetical protein
MAITYAVGVEGTPASPNDIATQCREAITAFWALAWNGLTITNTEIRWQDAALPAPPVIGIDTTAVTGGTSGSVFPQNSAYLIHKRTAFGGRPGRGRMYLPGVDEGRADNTGVIPSATQSSFNTALATWLTTLAGKTNITGMWLLHDDQGAGAGLSAYPITGLQLDPVIATQRRRLRR